METLYDDSIFEHDGHQFRVSFPFDADHGAPWDEEAGHGPVSDWTRRDKAPGERVLAVDHGSKRYYDFAAAVRIARRDGWDTPPYGAGAPGERAARAAEADFARMRAWLADEWHYCGCFVTLLDATEQESIWGLEDDCSAYLTETAHELAGAILSEIRREQERAASAARLGIATIPACC